MNKIQESFLKKYGWGEYLLFFLGSVVLGFQVFQYLTDKLEGDWLDGIMALCAIFCVLAPMSLLDFARKKAGMNTKS